MGNLWLHGVIKNTCWVVQLFFWFFFFKVEVQWAKDEEAFLSDFSVTFLWMCETAAEVFSKDSFDARGASRKLLSLKIFWRIFTQYIFQIIPTLHFSLRWIRKRVEKFRFFSGFQNIWSGLIFSKFSTGYKASFELTALRTKFCCNDLIKLYTV